MKLRIYLFTGILLAFGLGVSAQEKPNGMKSGTTQMAGSVSEPLKVGEIAPDFTLSDENNKSFTLSKAKMPVVLVFYRGYW